MRLLDKLLRIERLPEGEGPPLHPGERVTAWDGGVTAVATNRALWLRDPDWTRLVWADVHKATWADDVLTVTPGVEVEPGVVADGPLRRVRLAEPRHLPKEVRTRVTRSVAYTSHHRFAGSNRGVRVVARRVPGEDGLNWVLRFDPGVDRSDPLVRAEAEKFLHSAQAELVPSA